MWNFIIILFCLRGNSRLLDVKIPTNRPNETTMIWQWYNNHDNELSQLYDLVKKYVLPVERGRFTVGAVDKLHPY